MLCAIWYHLSNTKNVKKTYGGMSFLVKLQVVACNFTKSKTPPWLFLNGGNVKVGRLSWVWGGGESGSKLYLCIRTNWNHYQSLFYSKITKDSLTHSFPMHPFPTAWKHLKTSENRKVFWCFQGVEKGCIGNEWVKTKTSMHLVWCSMFSLNFALALDFLGDL